MLGLSEALELLENARELKSIQMSKTERMGINMVGVICFRVPL
jgi:hypothetical protein